ncbi:MAG: enoyl-CoA hydratase-related protein [Mycobacteriales bacterium]|nr:MAG: enoyl-CoA hydratase [Pseudonocardiales bacterium]
MSDTVLLDIGQGVGIITLNRPEQLNACNQELKATLLATLRNVAADDSIRAVVLTGAGKAFCAGQDLREHADRLDAGDPHPLRTVAGDYNPIVAAIVGLRVPVIAAVNGMAAGAGASFAFAADLRVAAESASFLMAFANIGLTLDSGSSWLLPRLIGHARATAMCLLAEPVPADQAMEMGLANAVVQDKRVLDTALGLAVKLAAGPTAAYAAIKSSLGYAATSTLGQALAKEAELQARAGHTEDHRNAVAAFLRKQKPSFTGR